MYEVLSSDLRTIASFRINNDEHFVKHDEPFIQNDELLIQNDEFSIKSDLEDDRPRAWAVVGVDEELVDQRRLLLNAKFIIHFEYKIRHFKCDESRYQGRRGRYEGHIRETPRGELFLLQNEIISQ